MRPDELIRIVPLSQVEASMADMSTVVIIGASTTRLIERSDDKTPYVYTPRFYGVRP
jgi:precorrin-3B C17-methyltransferase